MARTDIILNIDATVDVGSILRRFNHLVDDTTMLEIYNLWGKLMEPWVPMESGRLAHGYRVTPNSLIYPGPYAHYQYMGIVYGPNYPIFQNGELVGFRSPPGKGSKSPKVPTQEIVYNTELHPLATKEWDKVSYPVIKDAFLQGVREILLRGARQFYGN